MATEKILIFDEAGNAKRMKVRIARFLDNEPVTATDKENIRETLDVDGSQSGAFTTDLTTTQKLGAGTASPSHPLEVAGTNGSFSIAADGNTANFSRNASNYIAATADTSSSLAVLAKHSFQVHTGASTTERLRVDSSGRIGQAGITPGSYHGNADNLVIANDGLGGDTGLTIRSGTSSGGSIYFADGTTGDQRYRGLLSYSHNTDALSIGTVGVARWVLNNSGNLVAQQSGNGIDFGSVAGGTGTPATNGGLLDDYETGTATVAFAAGGGTVTIKSTHNTIYYTKIGNVVHFNGELAVDSINSPTGELMITGLPFAARNVSNNRSAISLHTSILNASTRLAGFVENGQSYVVVRLTGSTGYGQTAATVVQAGSGIVVGGSYRTA